MEEPRLDFSKIKGFPVVESTSEILMTTFWEISEEIIQILGTKIF